MRLLILMGAMFCASVASAQAARTQITAPQIRRPQITGIAYVRFHTSHRDEAGSFYGKVLGLPQRTPRVKSSGGNHVADSADSYAVGHTQTIFIDQRPSSDPGSNEEEIGLEVSDVSAMREFLTAHKLHDESPRRDQITIAGPEHLLFTFRQRASRDPEPSLDHAVSTRIIHVGFVVQDRAAADRFFKHILGFKLYWTGGPNWDGTPEHINYASMQVPDGHEWVEYMLNRQAGLTAKQNGSPNHVALGVVSIQDALKQLKANGYTGNAEPRLGQDGKWQLNLFDPDGTRVELMEFTPTRPPCCTQYQLPHPSPSER